MYPGGYHRAVEFRDPFERFRGVPGNDLHDGLESVLLVAGVGAFRGVADVEVPEPGLAGMPFKHRDAHFLGSAWVYGRLIHHDRTLSHVFAYRGACTDQRAKVRLVHRIHRGGNGDHDDIRGGKLRRIGRDRELSCSAQVLARDLPGRIDVTAVTLHLLDAEVESDGPKLLAECHCERQSHVT